MAITDAPYKPGDLAAPLTTQQRTDIQTWTESAIVYGQAQGWHFSRVPTSAEISAMPDATLLAFYNGIYVVAHTKMKGITLNPFDAGTLVNPATGQDVQNPITTIEQFLTNVANPHLWIRVGEFAVGALILAIGVNAILRPGQSLGSGVNKVANPVGTGIKAVHNSAHGAFQ